MSTFRARTGREGPFQDITLTFKEFNHHCYYLKDVPAGTAYVWFQIPLSMGTGQHRRLSLSIWNLLKERSDATISRSTCMTSSTL